ncbi:uncharacterized protein EI90DRAFT_1260487 [Cantharellus anzutake]|uniref:uncharacterized protein n=1 Tax=Cantharellus anzutake TaxID=1750568 RepID=UPI001906D61C|nr:uncharacterized protein EI90DRAFT_1260487 [Cantharellus anzutake]KAF8330044.1 hypothetical protein EI90DRAFT_1260487 [Cantharellus anzutake]
MMLKMFRLIFPAFIVALFVAQGFANPVAPLPVEVERRNDTTPATGPYNPLADPTILSPEPPITGTGETRDLARDYGHGHRCPHDYHKCSDHKCCPKDTYCWKGYCFPNGCDHCGHGYCKPGYRCYKGKYCIPVNTYPCGPYHFCYKGQECCNKEKGTCCPPGYLCHGYGCIPKGCNPCGDKHYCGPGYKCCKGGKACCRH